MPRTGPSTSGWCGASRWCRSRCGDRAGPRAAPTGPGPHPEAVRRTAAKSPCKLWRSRSKSAAVAFLTGFNFVNIEKFRGLSLRLRRVPYMVLQIVSRCCLRADLEVREKLAHPHERPTTAAARAPAAAGESSRATGDGSPAEHRAAVPRLVSRSVDPECVIPV